MRAPTTIDHKAHRQIVLAEKKAKRLAINKAKAKALKDSKMQID